jgi:hypothetical protein
VKEARIVEVLCQRYHALPSAVRAEDASILIHVAIFDALPKAE